MNFLFVHDEDIPETRRAHQYNIIYPDAGTTFSTCAPAVIEDESIGLV